MKVERILKTNFLFKAGGDGVSTPVRGYENASIEACGGTKSGTRTQRCDAVFPDGVSEGDTLILPETVGGHALVSGGLELRFPTFLGADLWGTVFVDFAAVAPAWAEMNNDRLFPSVGGGGSLFGDGANSPSTRFRLSPEGHCL